MQPTGPALAFAAILLAGCLAPAPPQGPAAPAPVPAPRALPEGVPAALALADCEDMTGRFPTPMAQIRGRVPAPLEPVPYDDTGTLGTLWVVGGRCATMRGGELDVGEVRFFLAAVPVDAPAAALPEGVRLVLAVLGGYVSDAGLARTLDAWGQEGVRTTEVPFDTGTGGHDLPAEAWRVSVDAAPRSEAMTVAAQGEVTTQSADVARFFLVRNGTVAGAVDWNLTEGLRRNGAATLADTFPGTGAHFWGEGYDYDLRAVALRDLHLGNATRAATGSPPSTFSVFIPLPPAPS